MVFMLGSPVSEQSYVKKFDIQSVESSGAASIAVGIAIDIECHALSSCVAKRN